MPADIFGILPGSQRPMTKIEYLDRSAFDDLAEIDTINNEYHNIYHVEGKLFVPTMDAPHGDMIRFVGENMIHPDDREAHQAMMEKTTLLQRLEESEEPGILFGEFRYRMMDGSYRWMEQILVAGAIHGLPEGIVRLYLFDVENQRSRRLGEHVGKSSDFPESRVLDELTGLRREKAYVSWVRKRLLEVEDPHEWCVIQIDIENFRLFNDWYGRDAGDRTLRDIGRILQEEEKACGGLAGYLGQDKFSLLCPCDEQHIQKLYERVRSCIAVHGVAVGFLPAFGVTKVDPTAPILDLLDQAGSAARAIKGNFRRRIRFFELSMRSRTEQEYRILSDFQRGLREHELSFFLQPQCEASTGKVVGAESLARWRLPNGAYLSPGIFVPVLEKYGFVTDLDRYVWEEVCRWLRRWLDAGHKAVPVSVNVSRIDIISLDVPEYLDELTERYRLPKELLKVEVTESAFVDDAACVRDTVQRLRELGFTILMDDFGTGYSSLSMLRRLNVDIIKLDGSFLQFNQENDEKALRIVETIVNMTKTIGLPVVVEGVETQEQEEYLAELGCGYIQGFYFYRPMPVDQFEQLIGKEENIQEDGIEFYAHQEIGIREFLNQNIYSDAMLNNVLGPVGFYEWDGDENVDIVRYNEAFYQLVNDPDFHSRIQGTQMFCHPNDLETYLGLFRQADLNRNTGASAVVGIYRGDGSLGQFLMRVYYFDQTEKGKVYYGSLQEVTEFTKLQMEMQMLSSFSSDTIVFMSKPLNQWLFEVIIHGMEKVLGMNRDALEEEMNSGAIFRRMAPEFRTQLKGLLDNAQEGKPIVIPFQFQASDGNWVELFAKVDFVHDQYSDVEYILTLSQKV